MEISWKSKKLKLELENFELLKSNYDEKIAFKVVQRIGELSSAPTYVDIPPNAKKHSIGKGKGFKYFTVDLPEKGKKRGKLRLAFIPTGEFDLANQKTIKSIEILGIIDPH